MRNSKTESAMRMAIRSAERSMQFWPRVGRTPDVLRKSGPMRDRTKYKRKPKFNEEESE